jgi:hypothetical protein
MESQSSPLDNWFSNVNYVIFSVNDIVDIGEPIIKRGGLVLQWIVCFVDIGGIVDHHCLNFLFIISYTYRT